MLYQTPARFDRVEVGRVRRQKQQLGTGRLNRFAHDGGVVWLQIVEDDDITASQARAESVTRVLEKLFGPDRTPEALLAHDAAAADRADDRDVLAPFDRLVVP